MRNLVESDGPLNVDEIRRALRVKWVLEGSVEKIGLFQRSLALQNYEAL